MLEDCALCQETISSSELAAKAREEQFEGQHLPFLLKNHIHTYAYMHSDA
jgi:hypothetical protein